MDLFDTAVLAAANTRCRLVETLEAELIVGNAGPCEPLASSALGFSSPEIMEELVKPGDIVLVNRYRRRCAPLTRRTGHHPSAAARTVPRTIVHRAERRAAPCLATPTTPAAARAHLPPPPPVRHFMRTKELLKFSVNHADRGREKGHSSDACRYFPILDENGKLLRRRQPPQPHLNLHRNG